METNGANGKGERIEISKELMQELKKFFVREARLLKYVTKRKGEKSYVSYRITLPKDLVEALNYSECEKVSVETSMTDDGEIVIIIRKCNPRQSSQVPRQFH